MDVLPWHHVKYCLLILDILYKVFNILFIAIYHSELGNFPVVICWNPQQHELFVLWHHYLYPYWRSKTFAKNLLLVSLPPLELQDINHLVLLPALTVSAQSTMWCNCKSPFKHFISYSYRSWSRSRRCYRSSNTFFTSTFINTKKSYVPEVCVLFLLR